MKKVTKALMAIAILITCAACCKENYVHITYGLNIPKSVLNQMTIKATYTGNRQGPVSFDISDSDWEDSSDPDYKRWTKNVCYEDFSVIKDSIDITILPKERGTTSPIALSVFSAFWDCKLEIRNDDHDIIKAVPTEFIQSVKINTEQEAIHLHKGFYVESNGNYKEL